jgi:hypothetical protein
MENRRKIIFELLEICSEKRFLNDVKEHQTFF